MGTLRKGDLTLRYVSIAGKSHLRIGEMVAMLLPSRIELEIVQVIDTPEATHIRYRVRR